MSIHHGTRHGIAYPEDLAFLSRVYDEACRRQGVSKHSEEGANLAHSVMALYAAGVRGERRMKMSLRVRSREFAELAG